MAKILYFHSPKEAELKDVPVKDGRMIVGEKIFNANESSPIMLKKFGKIKDSLYLLKWDCIEPAKIESKISLEEAERKEELENLKEQVVNPQNCNQIVRNIITNAIFTAYDIMPETLYKTESLKILGGLFKIKGAKRGGILGIIIGLVVGIVLTYLLVHFKLLH
jgi:hypothetical protein